MSKNIISYIAIFIALNCLAAVFFISPGYKIAGDAVSYHESIKYIEGQKVDGPLPLHRLLTTPLMISLSALLDRAVHSPYASMAVVNFVFYILLSIVFYKLAFEIYKDERVAFLSSIIFICNYHIINIDNLFIADMAGRFFFVLGNLLAIKYFYSQDKKYYYLTILISTVGILFKEFGALGMITLGTFILLSKINWKEKILLILKAALLFAIVPILLNLFFYYKFHFTYIDWYLYSSVVKPAGVYGLSVFIKVMGWIFLAGWPIFLLGLYREKKYFETDKSRSLIFLGMLPAALSFFAWPMFTYRTSFTLMPLISLIAGYGLSKINNKYLVILIIIFYLVVNYNIERLLPIINLPF